MSAHDATNPAPGDLGLFRRLDAEQRAGRPVVLATIIGRRGSVPREVGARMLIWADGSSEGTVGGGCVEADIRAAARRVLLQTKQAETVSVNLTDRAEGGTGDVCGGHMDVFLDYIHPEATNAGD